MDRYDPYTDKFIRDATDKNVETTDTISRQAAIDALNQQAETMCGWSERYAEQRKGILTAVNIVEDLPPVQPEQTGCDYCHEDIDGYVKPIEKNGHAFVRFGMNGWELSLKANGWNGEAKIQYCPMCGRKL